MPRHYIRFLFLWATLIFLLAYSAQAQTATDISVTVSTVGSSQIQLEGTIPSGTIEYLIASDGCGACTAPSHGTITGFNDDNGLLVYTPVDGYTGSDSFTYKVTDGSTSSSAATVTITVSSAKTTVTGTLENPDGTTRTGTITWILTQPATSPTGLISTATSVSAVLSSGAFSVSLWPSTGLSPQAYYQLWYKTTNSIRQELIGVYAIAASASSLDLSTCGCEVTDANLRARYTFASAAQVNNVLNLTRSFNVSKAGVDQGQFDTLDFEEGANITITPTDNLDGSITLAIAGPSGGGGGTVNSGTAGRLAYYPSSSTSVNSLTIGTANQFLKVNATTNGHNYVTPTAGTGIGITLTNTVFEIENTGVATINGESGGAHTLVAAVGTCGSAPEVTTSTTTHTVCVPSASVTATGTITASGTQQVIAGDKLFVGFANDDIPLTVRQKSSGSDTLQQWQNAGGSVTTGEHSVYGVWHRTLNAGVSEGAPTSLVNNGYIAKFYETSIGDCGTQPCKGLRTSIAYVGGTTSTTFTGITGAVDLAESGNLTDTNSSAVLATMAHTGSATVSGVVGVRSAISNSAGTLTTAYGVKVEPAIYGGTLTSLFSFYGKAVESSGGTLTNNYGLYLESVTAGATTNYGIYTNSGHNSFGDAISIRGIAAPAVGAADSGKLYYDSAADLLKLSINGGAYGNVGTYFEGSATINFASTAATACSAASTITVTGAVADKPVWLGVPNAAATSGVIFHAWVSAANTVSVQACNITAAGALDPASGTFTARVSQ